MANLQPSQRYARLSKERAAELIGFPNHETNQVMNRLLGMVQKSPFTEQSNAAELEEFTAARRDEVVAEVGNPADIVVRRQSLVEQGLADWKIHYELAEINRFLRNKEASYFHLLELVKLYPHNHESYIKLAEHLSSENKLREANEYLKQSLYYTRNDQTKDTQALGWIGLNYMKLNDYDQGQAYLEQLVDDYADQIGATIRAYGVLIKYAKERNQHNDFQSYFAGVKRYAKGLVAQDRAAEFPLLYRRMAQIMTMAGDKAEADRWQQMQAAKINTP